MPDNRRHQASLIRTASPYAFIGCCIIALIFATPSVVFAQDGDTEFITDVSGMLKLLLKGAWLTLALSVITGIVALITGSLVGIGTSARSVVIRSLSNLFIWLIRGTPLLVQLFISYFAFATIVNRMFDAEVINAFGAALIALIINTTAYNAETIRGGINSVEKGQWDAAASLGMGRNKIMRRVILPQAFSISLPSLGNNLVVLIKDTSLVGAITLIELTYTARNIMNQTAKPFLPFLLAAVFYLIIISLVTLGTKAWEKHMQRSKQAVGGNI